MVAAFDTVFHCSLPPSAYTYALPFDLAERHRIGAMVSMGYPMNTCCSGTAKSPELRKNRPPL
jgi:acetate kinase